MVGKQVGQMGAALGISGIFPGKAGDGKGDDRQTADDGNNSDNIKDGHRWY